MLEACQINPNVRGWTAFGLRIFNRNKNNGKGKMEKNERLLVRLLGYDERR